MHINNISQKAASFILHKRFHPGNFKNMEKVWIAEQRVADAARKDSELSQKRAQEMKIKELRQRNTDGSNSSDLIPSAIQWVYAHDDPKTVIPATIPSVTAEPDVTSGPSNTQSKRSSKYVLEEPTRFGQVSDADLMRKLREDPLMQIKKAEILRSRKEESKKELIVKRPRWDRPAASEHDYIISEDPRRAEDSPSQFSRESSPHLEGRDPLRRESKCRGTASPPRRRPPPPLSDDDEDLGPSSRMKDIIRSRHAEAVDPKLKKEDSNSPPANPPSNPQPPDRGESPVVDDLPSMLARGRDFEDERKLRVERIRLMEKSIEEADRPRGEMPAFRVRLQASVLDNYDREKALRNRKHDSSLLEDRKYDED